MCKTPKSGKARPKSRKELKLAPFAPSRNISLCEQNTVLYWAYELVDVGQLERRDPTEARYLNHMYYMRMALYLGDDLGFYNRCVEAGVPFWVRYAWFFGMLCYRDEDDLCLMGPVGVGLDDGMHGGRTSYGEATSKHDYYERGVGWI